MSISFTELGIHDSLAGALKKQGIIKPTAIQEQTIPFILDNRDVIGQSETGTGKTLAFLLPILQKIDINKKENQVMILTPTHELAVQIQKEIERLTKDSGFEITAAAIIGNVNIKRQIETLKAKQHIVVGSSGRIFELIQKKKITSHTIKMIVIDEADRLLDDDNSQIVKAVLKTALSKTQLLLFSATLSERTVQRASNLLKNPKVIRAAGKRQIPPAISHTYFIAEQRDKIEVLRKLIRLLLPTRALIFINKSEEIERLVERLRFHGLEARGIYGESNKVNRRQAIDRFKSGKLNLLVASDLAARGLDIKGISHVFNLDFPEDLQLYLHRVGRSGRAGERGEAISIVTAKEVSYIKRLENLYAIDFSHLEMAKGKIVHFRNGVSYN